MFFSGTVWNYCILYSPLGIDFKKGKMVTKQGGQESLCKSHIQQSWARIRMKEIEALALNTKSEGIPRNPLFTIMFSCNILKNQI